VQRVSMGDSDGYGFNILGGNKRPLVTLAFATWGDAEQARAEVVQNQRVITVAPVVTDAPFAVDDQRVDLQLSEARCNRKPCLASADNEDGRLAVGATRPTGSSPHGSAPNRGVQR